MQSPLRKERIKVQDNGAHSLVKRTISSNSDMSNDNPILSPKRTIRKKRVKSFIKKSVSPLSQKHKDVLRYCLSPQATTDQT